MRDKLTKKRVKVDYRLIIKVAGLEDKFSAYLWKRNKPRSIRREALWFLQKSKVDIEYYYNLCLDHGVTSYDELLDEQIRIVKTNIWED